MLFYGIGYTLFFYDAVSLEASASLWVALLVTLTTNPFFMIAVRARKGIVRMERKKMFLTAVFLFQAVPMVVIWACIYAVDAVCYVCFTNLPMLRYPLLLTYSILFLAIHFLGLVSSAFVVRNFGKGLKDRFMKETKRLDARAAASSSGREMWVEE